MTVGLLICDHVAEAYQDAFGDYPDMFTRLFPEFDWVHYAVYQMEFPQNLDECDWYISTGSKHSAYEALPWISQLKDLIKRLYEQQKKYVGVCFGHQVLAEALGGRVEKSSRGWCVGMHSFEVKERMAWMRPPLSSIQLLMMCQDQVVQMPEGSVLLAGNEQCPVGVFQLGTNMLGIQAHPEFSKVYDQHLMEQRVDRMGEEVVRGGIASLEERVDREAIREWILNFVKEDL